MINRNEVIKAAMNLYNKKGNNNSKFATKIHVDKSTVSNWLHDEAEITLKNYDKAIEFFETWSSETNYIDFYHNLCASLSINYPYIESAMATCHEQQSLSAKIEYMRLYNVSDDSLFETIDIKLLTHYIRNIFLKPLHPYIIMPHIKLKDSGDGFIKHDLNNYLIFRVKSYGIMTIFTSIEPSDVTTIITNIEELIKYYNINMFIVFSDKPQKIKEQKILLNNFNLFWETITPSELDTIKSIEYVISSPSIIENDLRTFKCGKIVIERLISYFSLIRDEIVFNELIKKEQSDEKISDAKSFFGRGFLKDWLQYTYLSRHSVYFERERLLEFIGDKKLDMVLELSCTNALFSYSIIDRCEKIHLLSSSKNSIRFYNDVFAKLSIGKIDTMKIPIHPSYVSNFYDEEFTNKVDLVILSFGFGSQLSGLTEYMRNIINWLKPDGMILISFVNANSILFTQDEIAFPDTTSYGILRYKSDFDTNVLSYCKRYYALEAANEISQYFTDVKYYTYPFVSAITDNGTIDTKINRSVRALDKYAALRRDPEHLDIADYGHIITVLGRGVPTKKNALKIDGLTQKKIKLNDLSSTPISHPLVTSILNAQEVLADKGVNLLEAEMLKTILIERKKHGERKLIYIITSSDVRLSLNRKDGWFFVHEKDVVGFFGTGIISPFSYELTNEDRYMKGEFYHYQIKANKPYVLFSSGLNNKTIKLRTVDFMELLGKDKIQDFNASSDFESMLK